MSRRFVAAVAVALAVAIALPAALSFALVEERGGSGVLEGTIWVANEGSDRLTGIDADTHVVVTVLAGIAAPHNVQVSPDGRTVWATSTGRGLAAAIDPAVGTVVGTVLVGDAPAHVIVTPDGRRALVTVAGAGTVAVIDVETMRLERGAAGRRVPARAAAEPRRADGPRGRHGRRHRHALRPRDAPPARRRARWWATPVQVAYAPDGRDAYVSLNGPGEVVKIDLEAMAVAGRVAVPPGPVQIVVTPDGTTLLVASQGTKEAPGDTLAFVDTAAMTVTGLLAVGCRSPRRGRRSERAAGVRDRHLGRRASSWSTSSGGRSSTGSRSAASRTASASPRSRRSTSARSRSSGARSSLELPLGGRLDGGGSGGSGHQH